MKCPECRSDQIVETTEDWNYEESGLKNVVLQRLKVRHCKSCGEVMPVIPNVDGLHTVMARTLAERETRLAPEELRFLRKQIGFSGADFAKYMSVDPATVSRWENGKEPIGPQSEKLLRLTVLSGKTVDEYPIQQIAHMGKKKRKSEKLQLRASNKGWTESIL